MGKQGTCLERVKIDVRLEPVTYNPFEKSVPEPKMENSRKGGGEYSLFDDFTEKSDYWSYRVNGIAEIRIEDSILKLYMGPTEALYYSNAEISDGDFDSLRWQNKNLEFKARIIGGHYGSAGFGFWNYSMNIDESVPIWFIYLKTRSRKYPLNGFFVQAGNFFRPIKYFVEQSISLRLVFRAFKWLLPIKIIDLKPSLPDIDLSEWHIYRILWGRHTIKYEIDGENVAELPVPRSKYNYRVDAWIDNAVFIPLKNDYAQVYRHVTHENRHRGILETDYVKLW